MLLSSLLLGCFHSTGFSVLFHFHRWVNLLGSVSSLLSLLGVEFWTPREFPTHDISTDLVSTSIIPNALDKYACQDQWINFNNIIYPFLSSQQSYKCLSSSYSWTIKQQIQEKLINSEGRISLEPQTKQYPMTSPYLTLHRHGLIFKILSHVASSCEGSASVCFQSTAHINTCPIVFF